jgi:hypothetical protein
MWADLCGRAVILSPRDWSIVDGWHERGIPLQIIEEAMQAAAESRARGRKTEPPRRLSYIAQAVEEGWMAVLEGRASRADEGRKVEKREDSPVSSWRARPLRESESSALSALLTELLEAFDEGRPAAQLDGSLDSRLPAVVPEELLKTVEQEVARELAPYRDRMASGAYDATFKRAVALRLRVKLKLDRLLPY